MPTRSWPQPSRNESPPSTGRGRRTSLPRRSSRVFESIPEQGEAKRLLAAALAAGPAHAYLFHGPAGVGKRATALAFASELLSGDPRVGRRTHPDLYVLEPLGDQIRIDAVREMRRDLHMRPFEADRRGFPPFRGPLFEAQAPPPPREGLQGAPAH